MDSCCRNNPIAIYWGVANKSITVRSYRTKRFTFYPGRNADGKNNTRIIKSKSGHNIIFNDEQGSEKVEIITKSGNQIILDDSTGKEKIEIKDKTGSNSIIIDAAQNSISMSSTMKVSIQAQMIEIKAGGTLNLQGGLVKIN